MTDRLPHEKGFHVSWDQIHRDARALAWRRRRRPSAGSRGGSARRQAQGSTAEGGPCDACPRPGVYAFSTAAPSRPAQQQELDPAAIAFGEGP